MHAHGWTGTVRRLDGLVALAQGGGELLVQRRCRLGVGRIQSRLALAHGVQQPRLLRAQSLTAQATARVVRACCGGRALRGVAQSRQRWVWVWRWGEG